MVSVLLVGATALLYSCASMPDRAVPVTNFDVHRYLGTWYEIARFDFKFERDLDNTTANYTLDSDGDVIVLNSGYNYVDKEWERAEGIAKFRSEPSVGALKVSFFRPFYSGYNVVAIDKEYRYALIAGASLDYLWILSRTTEVPPEIKDTYLKLATDIGYDTTRLLWVKHDRTDNPYRREQ